MSEKLRDIKETTSDAVEILRELGNPAVRESLDKIKETAHSAQIVLDTLKEPEIVKNIENTRLTAEAIQETSKRIEKMVIEIKETGLIDQTSGAIRSAKDTLEAISNDRTAGEITLSMKELVSSLNSLIEELRLVLASFKKSGVIHNVKEIAHEVDNMYKAVQE